MVAELLVTWLLLTEEEEIVTAGPKACANSDGDPSTVVSKHMSGDAPILLTTLLCILEEVESPGVDVDGVANAAVDADVGAAGAVSGYMSDEAPEL